ncbi:MAG TPA: non-canonical purine NTP pyrophosphatase, partial [Pseudomonadota bacterium]|nr:non-canonical purine NTP pyrophosphatase [Pseudomonadota bacterium]
MGTPPPLSICLATHNAHKVAELRALLRQHAPTLATGLRLLSLSELGVHEAAVEDGSDCPSNAYKKARHAAERTGLWSLADDSGLFVNALAGAPGVHSARYGGEPAEGQSQDARNRQVLLSALAQVPAGGRGAFFLCVLCLHPPVAAQAPAGAALFSEGRCSGALLLAESGGGGFGYDPLFVPDADELAQAGLGLDRVGLSFGVLTSEDKNQLSHRTRALLALLP